MVFNTASIGKCFEYATLVKTPQNTGNWKLSLFREIPDQKISRNTGNLPEAFKKLFKKDWQNSQENNCDENLFLV